jgi:hypothetical protein
MRAPLYHVWIPTYNRPELLFDLLKDLVRESKEHSVVVSVFDDGSTEDYSECKLLLSEHGWTWHQLEHCGKGGYWKLIDHAHKTLRESAANWFVQLADDFRLCRHFLTRCTESWSSIEDNKKICLNVLCDKSRLNTPCWSGIYPERVNKDVRKIGWVDGAHFSSRGYYELLKWSCREPLGYSKRGNKTGSGVYWAITQDILNAKKNMYQVARSLVVHRVVKSAMHPNLGPARLLSLRAHRFVGGSESEKRLLYGDKVHVCMCSIPSREKQLEECVASLLPQVSDIHVVLNGYSKVPAFLDHKRITVYRSSDIGNFRSDAKFWPIEDLHGYIFLCDDDLTYHETYVPILISWIEHTKRKAVCAMHGAVLLDPTTGYYESRKSYPCLHQVLDRQWVHVGGTGAMAFHTDTIKVKRAVTCLRNVHDEREHNMSDLVMAKLTQTKRIPVLVAPHSSGVVVQRVLDEGIYEHGAKKDGSVFDSRRVSSDFVRGRSWKLFSIEEETQDVEECVTTKRKRKPFFVMRFNHA